MPEWNEDLKNGGIVDGGSRKSETISALCDIGPHKRSMEQSHFPLDARAFVFVCTCVRACVHACVRVCVRACVCVCACMCVRACVRACVQSHQTIKIQVTGYFLKT